MKRALSRVLFTVFFLAAAFASVSAAEINFDFGLPVFGMEEIRFEKTKPVDFNLQLLKKYLNEHQGSVLPQLHGINRWFSLLRLSDAPRKEQLISESKKFFTLKPGSKADSEERIRSVFFHGLLLSQDKSADPENLKDHEFEDLLIESEDYLAESGDYSLIKGILFHHLRNRPNNYFEPMKPEEDLKKALAYMPKTAHYYFVIGQAFRMLGSNDSSLFLAIASYEKASSLEPRNAKLQNSLLGIYMGLHEEFQSRGRPEPFWLEEAVYKKILTVSPNNPHALNNLGYLYAEYGVNTQLAQELCQRAVDMHPENPGFRDSLGWAAFKNRDYARAEEELKRSIEMKKNVYEPLYHLATVYYATGDLDKAAEYYEQAIELRPDSAEALNNLAYLYTEKNIKHKEALTMAETAVRLEPNNASYLDTLGWAHYRLGNFDQALRFLLRAAQLSPGQGEILSHIGRVYMEKGDYATAIAYLKEAHKADPKLTDADNAIYLAIRLKSYQTALADYHSLLGANAEKEKIINILMAISRLYQEERQYDKAIEFTKLCAEIKRGDRSLDVPVLATYSLTSKKESADEADTPLPQVSEEQKSTEPAASKASNETSQEKEPVFAPLPPEIPHPFVISFGPAFFNLLKPVIPGCEVFSDKSLTVFIATLRQAGRFAIVRVESESTSGTAMLNLFDRYFRSMNATETGSNSPDAREFRLGRRQIFMAAFGNALYLSRKPLTGDMAPEKLAEICPYISDNFSQLLYNWKNMASQIPRWIRPFINNPAHPFTRIHTIYTLKDGSLNEFSTATTGQKESDAFLRQFARKLFQFKINLQKQGYATTIKMKSDNDLIFISTDFENIQQTLTEKYGNIFKILAGLYKPHISRAQCYLNRMLFNGTATGLCPSGGKTAANTFSGLAECTLHKELPVSPIFFDEAGACRYSRLRLEAIIAERNLNTPENRKDLNFIKSLAQKLQIPLCPTDGVWSLDESGHIGCTDHEN